MSGCNIYGDHIGKWGNVAIQPKNHDTPSIIGNIITVTEPDVSPTIPIAVLAQAEIGLPSDFRGKKWTLPWTICFRTKVKTFMENLDQHVMPLIWKKNWITRRKRLHQYFPRWKRIQKLIIKHKYHSSIESCNESCRATQGPWGNEHIHISNNRKSIVQLQLYVRNRMSTV